MSRFLVLLTVLLAGFIRPAEAHEVRPVYLEITAHDNLHLDILLKRPVLGNRALNVVLVLPDDCTETPVISQPVPGALIERSRVTCKTSPFGRTARLAGLEGTLTDALVRVVHPSGEVSTVRLTPDDTAFAVPQATGPGAVLKAYIGLGIEHILFGFDHLSFVAGLLLLVGSFRRLLVTVTAFTLAHSITLSAAALGFVHVPPAPVEALIALSILFVAVEAAELAQGKAGPIAQHPARIAFSFGLLHGLGFASALKETGLPDHEIPLALFSFNVGVEVGQITFIIALTIAAFVATRFVRLSQPAILKFGAYVIGPLAAFWCLDRLSNII